MKAKEIAKRFIFNIKRHVLSNVSRKLLTYYQGIYNNQTSTNLTETKQIINDIMNSN